MDLRTALLLPGQGAYRPGAFAGHRSAPVADLLAVVDAVAAEFGHGAISPLLTDDGAADGRRLAETDPFALQLAIYAAALVYAREVDLREPADVVVGHSMGEMAAAAHAGCFTAADGARVAAHRARALEHTAAGTGGMLALTLPARRATALLAAAELPGARLAVVNAPRHVVASGPDEALGRLAALADVLGVRAVRLTAPYPFHNPLLATAQAEFAAAIEGIPERPAERRLYSPALGGLVTDDTGVKASLVAQVTRPVDFLAALRDLQTYGLESVVECGRAGLGELVRQAVGCDAQTAERWLAGRAGERPADAPTAAAAAAAVPAAPGTTAAPAAPAVPAAPAGPAVPDSGAAAGPAPAARAVPGAPMPVATPALAPASAATAVPAVPAASDAGAAAGPAPAAPAAPGAPMPVATPAPAPASAVPAASAMPAATAVPDAAGAAPGPARAARAVHGPSMPVATPAPTPVPATPPVAPDPLAAAPAAPAGPAAGGDVLGTLQQVYADRLGYPVEAMDPDADLEGDLGIDSLKRMEVLSTLIDRFGLHHVADDTRFALQSTLGGLARLIDETGRTTAAGTGVRADG
ncbi:acyltransferase domain-containing protein [Streptomyces sp. WMMC500]|uniref:acyltransferase domain-containing protein n=1 Tax=Streptomyces sp. WMMC500 TaxID=3015154 RepID=UPI00248B6A63|nr:acyltransferase domain-containing protein [Streptomyces sp. WMMC500]WBB61548.1 acyltransferase domain-containing protein [Streptomyces sp. WMMC500]